MIILDLCGGTGAWSAPYKAAGYDVRIVTLPNDVRLYAPPDDVYGILAAPPCAEFSFSRHFHGRGKYVPDFRQGLEIVSACMRIILTCNPVWWALENPAGYLTRWLKKPMLIFDPWEYGNNYQKRTMLWGNFNLPEKIVTEKPTGIVKFSMMKSKDIYPEYYGLYSRQERRGITPPGFAQAFFNANR